MAFLEEVTGGGLEIPKPCTLRGRNLAVTFEHSWRLRSESSSATYWLGGPNLSTFLSIPKPQLLHLPTESTALT